jgi:hypothetical protein
MSMLQTWNFEERLQEAVAEHPELAAGADKSALYFLGGREIAIGSGFADVILLNREGMPTIVETKLLRNPDYPNVIRQALRYRDWLLARPDAGATAIDGHFSRTANLRLNGAIRYIAERLGLATTAAETFRKELRGRIAGALRKRQIRITVIADVITPDLVERAESARTKDRTLALDLIELTPSLSGGTLCRFFTEPAVAYRRGWTCPVFHVPDWEVVATDPLPAAKLHNNPPRDRFYGRHGHRVLEVADGFPDTFSCERAFGRVPGMRSNIHQVDPSRQESCAPLMPSHRLWVETGAPYPSEPHPHLITDNRFRSFVHISLAVWKELAAANVLTLRGPNDPATDAILAGSRMALGPGSRDDALRCVTDTLRDLALWGIVKQERRGLHERRFTLEPFTSRKDTPPV